MSGKLPSPQFAADRRAGLVWIAVPTLFKARSQGFRFGSIVSLRYYRDNTFRVVQAAGAARSDLHVTAAADAIVSGRSAETCVRRPADSRLSHNL